MRQLTIWLISVLFFAAAGGLATWLFFHGQDQPSGQHPASAEAPAESADQTPAEAEAPVVSRDACGAMVVRMDPETRQRVDLRVEPLQAVTDQPQLTAYGSVQENPAQSFTLRAPVTGTIMVGADRPWPALGEQLDSGTQVGAFLPRLGPLERVDLESRLATAHADVDDARASLVALRSSLEGKRQLNADGRRIISEQALQEAEAKVKSEEARLRAAQETVTTLAGSMSTTLKPSDVIALVLPRSGRVVEVLAHPGEAVESGQTLLRVSDFDHLSARVALPAGQIMPKVESATVIVSGYEDYPLTAHETSPAPAVDPVTGGQTFLLEFFAEGVSVQPGMAVTARLGAPGKPLEGVLVPPGAIVRYVGAGWVYVQSDEDSFVRREVPLTRRTSQGWFVAEGLTAGMPVVIQAAQSLLSQELKFQQGGGGEEEE